MADLQLPQLKLYTGVITDDPTGDGQIQAAHAATAIFRCTAGHRDGENLIALMPDRIGEADVLTTEQQHVTFLKADGVEGVPTATAATNQA